MTILTVEQVIMAARLHFRIFVLLLVCLSITVTSDASGSCDVNWVAKGDYCYRLSTSRLSQSQAVTECRKWSAVLLRIYDSSALSDVMSITNSTAVTRWWTDLNDYKRAGIWMWGNTGYSALLETGVLKWNMEPDDTAHLENCGAINIQGALSDERCGDRHGYICEYTISLPGTHCQGGWSSYKTGCYYFASESDSFNLVTWAAASHACAVYFAGMPNVINIRPHLIYLESADEQASIRRQLPLIPLTSQMWWIGMTDNQTEGHFRWGDGGKVVQTNTLTWANESNNLGGVERCGVLYMNGRFADLNCNNSENYICMKESNDNPAGMLTKLGCPDNWIRAGPSCYRLNPAPLLTWTDANAACQQAGASLLKVDSKDENIWLQTQSLEFHRSHWTGLNMQQDRATWRWADGSAADLTLIEWTKEPNNFEGSEDCGVIYQTGTFNDVPCLMPSRFICESQTEDSPCPPGWLQNFVGDETNCYYISNATATNDEAHAQCTQMSFPKESYLWAINTKDELNYITNQLKTLKPTNGGWFTGLTDKLNEGYWTYDTSFNQPPPANFIPWTQMPLFPTRTEYCALMAYHGQFGNRECSLNAPYICERPAFGSAGTVSNVGSRFFINKHAAASCVLAAIYFLSYGLCLHYVLHVIFVM